EARRGGLRGNGDGGVANLARVVRAARQRVDLEPDRLVPELAHVLGDGAGRLQPRFKAFIPDAGDCHRDEAASRRAEIDGPAGAGRFGTDAGQGVLAGAVVGQLATALLQHRAVDFTKARSLVLDAR